MASRRSWQLRISEEARAGFDRYCTEQGVTATALIEALGLAIGRTAEIPASVIRAARAIDAQRRNR